MAINTNYEYTPNGYGTREISAEARNNIMRVRALNHNHSSSLNGSDTTNIVAQIFATKDDIEALNVQIHDLRDNLEDAHEAIALLANLLEGDIPKKNKEK